MTADRPAPPSPSMWVGHQPGGAEYRRVLFALFFAGVATFALLYAPQGVLPQIASELGIGAAQASLTISVATLGLAAGVIPWSLVADRIGRVKAMSWSVGGAALVGLLVPFAPTYPLMLAGRLIEGVLIGGVPAVAIAYLTEEVAPSHATRAAGIYVAGTSIGGILGRLIPGPVADLTHWRIGIVTVTVLCGLAAVAYIKLAPVPRGFQATTTGAASPDGRLFARLWVNLRNPVQLVLFAQGFLLMGGFVALSNFLGFRLTEKPFLLSDTVASLAFLTYLAGTWASARAGAEASRFGRKPILLASLATMTTGIMTMASSHLAVMIAGLVITIVGFFGAHAIASGWTASAAVAGKAQASSLYTLAYYGGSSAIGWIGGVAFDTSGWAGVTVTIGASTLLAGVLAAAGLPGSDSRCSRGRPRQRRSTLIHASPRR